MSDGAIYERLIQPFPTFKDTRGGATFDYITGEQCVTRLNTELGPWGWSFRVVEHGFNTEADEFWVNGELTATFPVDGEQRTVTRQQFGSQKIKRKRADGVPLDIGFDLKGATTDALKKCATLIGVALYLSEKDNPRANAEADFMDAASRAIDLEHPQAEKLRTAKASDLDDATLSKTTRTLRAWLDSKQAE